MASSDRQAAQRKQKLDDIQQELKDGRLTSRQMTKAEKAAWDKNRAENPPPSRARSTRAR